MIIFWTSFVFVPITSMDEKFFLLHSCKFVIVFWNEGKQNFIPEAAKNTLNSSYRLYPWIGKPHFSQLDEGPYNWFQLMPYQSNVESCMNRFINTSPYPLRWLILLVYLFNFILHFFYWKSTRFKVMINTKRSPFWVIIEP